MITKYKCFVCGHTNSEYINNTLRRCSYCYTVDYINKDNPKYNWQDGAKEDTNLKQSKAKLRYDLLPIEAIEEIIKVLMGGIAKGYLEDSWKDVDREDYISAIYRHLGEIKKGNDIDNDFGLHHSAHIATDAIFLLYKDIINK